MCDCETLRRRGGLAWFALCVPSSYSAQQPDRVNSPCATAWLSGGWQQAWRRLEQRSTAEAAAIQQCTQQCCPGGWVAACSKTSSTMADRALTSGPSAQPNIKRRHTEHTAQQRVVAVPSNSTADSRQAPPPVQTSRWQACGSRLRGWRDRVGETGLEGRVVCKRDPAVRRGVQPKWYDWSAAGEPRINATEAGVGKAELWPPRLQQCTQRLPCRLATASSSPATQRQQQQRLHTAGSPCTPAERRRLPCRMTTSSSSPSAAMR